MLHTKAVWDNSVQIGGITAPRGIMLITQDDRFPRIVEEEERWHGVFLGSSAHGILCSVFDSFKFGEPRFEVISRRHLYKNAYNPRYNIKAANRFRYYSSRMIDDSIILHESIAKYLSFLMAGLYYHDLDNSELKRLYVQRSAQFSGLFLNRLVELLGHPLDNPHPTFARNFLHMAAKALLAAPELAYLNQIRDRSRLRSSILNGDFWSTYTPNNAFRLFLEKVGRDDIRALKFSFLRFMDLSNNRYEGYLKFESYLYDFIRNLLRANDHEIPEQQSRQGIVLSGCQLAINLRYIFACITNYYAADRFDYKINNDGFIEPEFSPTCTPEYFFMDTACDIFYTARNVANEEHIMSIKKATKLLQSKSPNLLLIIPVPNVPTAKIKLFIYSYSSSSISISSDPNITAEPSPCILTEIAKPSDLKNLKKAFPLSILAFLFVAPFDRGFESIRNWLSDIFANYGCVIFLDTWCFLSMAMRADYVHFANYPLPPYAKGYKDSRTQVYKVLAQFYTLRDYATISAVPYYYEELFFRARAENKIAQKPKLLFANEGVRTKSGKPLFEYAMAVQTASRACFVSDLITSDIYSVKEEALWIFQES